MTEPTYDEIRSAVRQQYGSIARGVGGCCAPGTCGPNAKGSLALGYSAEELAAVPEGANMGLGCGNPRAIARLREGETVLDLGSGAGFDCLLAAQQVGPKGQVVGVDMTPEMVTKARANARQLGATHVDFRLGEIEHLPVADSSVDVVISNCVINLSPDKEQVFRDAFRVLKAGGRLAIADVLAVRPLPQAMKREVAARPGCIGGAADVAAVEALLGKVGFERVRVTLGEDSHVFIRDWIPGSGLEEYVASASIEATKPRVSCCAPSCCQTGAVL